MKSVAVFCGSSEGSKPIYNRIANELGRLLAEKQIQLIYGGAKIGLMGQVANGCLDADGKVIGVIPTFLKTKEVAHDNLTKLIEVKTMHERKTKMSDLADGIIALPGGFGTMEEFFEILTWGQLGLHSKPMGLLNVNGFYDSLIELFNVMVNQDFLKPINREMVITDDNAAGLLKTMQRYQAPDIKKWITPNKT